MPEMIYSYADGQVKLTPMRIGGVPIPCPSEWNISESDLQKNSERNAAGYLVTDRIRTNVRKFELKWSFLLPKDFVALKKLISQNMFMAIEYADEAGAMNTATVYKGDLTRTVSRILATGEIQGFLNVSVNLIER